MTSLILALTKIRGLCVVGVVIGHVDVISVGRGGQLKLFD